MLRVRPRPVGPRRPSGRADGRPSAARAERAAALVAVAAVAVLPSPAGANSTTPLYASPQGVPPTLTVPDAELVKALKCSPGVDGATRTPVLLVPATGVTPEQNYDWNWKPALAAQGIPYCTIELPQRSLGDVQTAGEHVVYAIRRMHERAGRRISIIGHSQGGMVFRWAFRFWKDTRPMVDDAIGFAGSNHGTDVLKLPICETIGCPPAAAQQASGSAFLRALNSRQETFAGISYTNVRTQNDEVVLLVGTQPQDASPYIKPFWPSNGVTNVAVQDVCPLDQTEHLTVGTISNTAYALAMDALTHEGPAEPERAKAAACSALLMPGVQPQNLEANLQILAALPGLASVAGVNLAGVPLVTKEPALKPYVGSIYGGGPADDDPADRAATPSPATAATRVRLTVTPPRLRAGRTTTLRVRTTTSAGKPLAKVRVRLFGRVLRTNAKGRATLRVRPAKAALVTARATGAGLRATTTRLRVLRAR